MNMTGFDLGVWIAAYFAVGFIRAIFSSGGSHERNKEN